MLKEDVAGTVQEDHEGLGKLAGGDTRLPLSNDRARGLNVPCPSEVRPTAHPSTQRQKTVPEEDSALDEVCKTVKDVVTPLQTNVSKTETVLVIMQEILTKIPP